MTQSHRRCTLKRFLISGSTRFNNYYLFSKYVTEYLPPNPVIVTCGGTGGTDEMAREYCNRNNILIEEYPCSTPDVDKVVERNVQIMGYCNSSLIFDDGLSRGTVFYLRKQLNATSKALVVVEINERDNIDCHYQCTNEFLTTYFNLCNRTGYSIHMLTDISLAILYHDEVLQHILDAKEEEFTKSEDINMAAGFAHWLKQNAVPYMKRRLIHEERTMPKESRVSVEELANIWNNKIHPARVITTENLPVLADFDTTVADGKQLWLEATDDKVVKINLWQTLDQLKSLKDDENPVNTYYTTKDNSKTVVFFRNEEFDNSPFKADRWYFNVQTLKC